MTTGETVLEVTKVIFNVVQVVGLAYIAAVVHHRDRVDAAARRGEVDRRDPDG